MKYVVQRDYKSALGQFRAGEIVSMPEDAVEWLNRDSPGLLLPMEDDERALDKPPRDRMIRKPRKR